jgi:hypothetical protein
MTALPLGSRRVVTPHDGCVLRRVWMLRRRRRRGLESLSGGVY